MPRIPATVERGRPPKQEPQKRRWRVTAAWAGVAAAVAIGVLSAGATTSWSFGFGGGSSTEAGGSGAYTGGVGGSGARTHTPAGMHREYADNRNGSPVFASPAGAPAPGDLTRIPFNTPVDVKCVVPNSSGMQSVTGFYLIGDTKWKGLYVVVDTMSNGGPPGTTTSPNVDPKVPRCP